MSSQTVRFAKKICLLGDPAVGKTSLIRRYVYDIFGDEYLSTVGAKVVTRTNYYDYPEQDKRVELKMLIWDIAGQKIVDSVHQAYYRGAEAAFIVADVTRRQTFETIESWVRELYANAGEIPVLLLANKTDLTAAVEVTSAEIEQHAQKLGVSYLSTSAKSGKNVQQAFDTIGKFMAEKVV